MPISKRLLKAEVDRLHSAIAKVEGAIAANQTALTRYKQERVIAEKKLDEYMGEEKELKVTEHALVRYMERHMNLDMDTLRSQIATEELAVRVDKCGGHGKFTLASGIVVVEDWTIITFLSEPKQKS